VYYEPVTYLDGIMEKYIPGDYEFDVPKKLIDLIMQKDYGVYGVNGKCLFVLLLQLILQEEIWKSCS
jgi:hypothetical protein